MLLNSLLFIVGLMAVDALALPVKRQQATKLGGVNLAVCSPPTDPFAKYDAECQGCEFGMTTEGGSGTYYCPGTDQITHFTSKGANLYVSSFLPSLSLTSRMTSTDSQLPTPVRMAIHGRKQPSFHLSRPNLLGQIRYLGPRCAQVGWICHVGSSQLRQVERRCGGSRWT